MRKKNDEKNKEKLQNKKERLDRTKINIELLVEALNHEEKSDNKQE